MVDWIARQFIASVRWLEWLLALAVLGGTVVYAIESWPVMTGMDWGASETFDELVYRVLLIVIGLELVRTLIMHDLSAVLELLAFVITRRVLKPEIDSLDIVLAILAFVALLAARRYLLSAPSQGEPVHAENSAHAGHIPGSKR